MILLKNAYRIYKTIIVCLICTITINFFGVTSFAAWVKEDGKIYYAKNDGGYITGWQTIGGKTYYFDKDGTAVTKSKTIDGVKYIFSSDGVCTGKYTGWAKDSKYRYYYKDGTKQTGWLQVSGKTYFFNRDGIMRTGWVAQWGVSIEIYFFDKNGVWDGDEAKSLLSYRPVTIGDFLLDHEFPISGNYDARRGNSEFKEFSGIKTALNILEQNVDAKLLYDKREADDQILLNDAIYRGDDDVFVRLRGDNGLAAPGLHFSKDKKGNSYFYCNSYNFGIKLDDSDLYDEIAKLIAN